MIFKKISEKLPGYRTTIVVKPVTATNVTVMIHFTKDATNKDGQELLPLVITGTPDEIEANIDSLIDSATDKVITFMSNAESFSKQEPKPPASTTISKKQAAKQQSKVVEKTPELQLRDDDDNDEGKDDDNGDINELPFGDGNTEPEPEPVKETAPKTQSMPSKGLTREQIMNSDTPAAQAQGITGTQVPTPPVQGVTTEAKKEETNDQLTITDEW